MFKTIIGSIKEIFFNRKRIFKISFYNLIFQYNQTKLKLLWTILNPVLQAGTYWLVFYIGMRTNAPVDGVSYLSWMLTGLVPWFYFSFVLIGGLNSIINSSGILKNMRYPVSIIPICTVMTELFSHVMFMLVLICILLCSGVSFGINALYCIYYCFAATVLLIGYTYLMSALTVFFRDLQRVVSAVIRLLFFISPVCWVANNPDFDVFIKWNPIAFLIEGYRETLLYNKFSIADSYQHLYFWIFSAALFLVGFIVHNRYRNVFVDYL